jgi:arginase
MQPAADRKLNFVFIKSELGAGTYGASLGPDALHLFALQNDDPLFENHPSASIELGYEGITTPVKDPHAWHIDFVLAIYQRLSAKVSRLLDTGYFPFVIAGDHSSAGGTIAGIRDAHPDKRLGVIWIDAHGDLHTPYTTPSGNMHGMPLGTALGITNEEHKRNEILERTRRRWDQLTNLHGIRPKIQPEDLVFIGIRDLEDPEWEIVRSKGIKWFGPQEIRDKGPTRVVTETLAHLAHCDELYLSFDIDSMDASLVPGTGTPVSDGLTEEQAAEFLQGFWERAPLVAMEITEVNPMLDHGNVTVARVYRLLKGLLGNHPVSPAVLL